MKASTVIAAAAALTGSIVSAQLTDIPQCALTCAFSSLGTTGCQTTDIKCICQASAFVSQLTPCVQAACSAADLQKTITAAEGLCKSAGVSLSIPPVSGAASATSAAAVTSAAAGTTSAAAVSTTTEAVLTLTTSSVSSVYVVPSSNATVTQSVIVIPTANSTVTTGTPSASTSSLPSPTPSGNAAGRNAVALGGLGAVLAFAVALL